MEEQINIQYEHIDEETIKQWSATIDKEEEKRNTITLQEFEPFFPIYNEELLSNTNPRHLEKVLALFRFRFNLYKNITVTDSMGKILFEIPPSFISCKLWNETKEGKDSLGARYLSALEVKNPINGSDVPVLKDIVNAIDHSKDPNTILNYFKERLRIENEYSDVYNLKKSQTDISDTEEITEENESDNRININTDDLF